MAGIPADLTVYADSNVSHDHTYYGRGCSNGWGTSGEDGSQTPCADSDAGGQYVVTADGETQKTGTFYHFQAATVGTGYDLTTDNAVVVGSPAKIVKYKNYIRQEGAVHHAGSRTHTIF